MIKVEWSEEDQEWVATHPDYPSLSWLDEDPNAAKRGLRKLMADEGLKMTRGEALGVVIDAAESWLNELSEYIIPASEAAEDGCDYQTSHDEIVEAVEVLRRGA